MAARVPAAVRPRPAPPRPARPGRGRRPRRLPAVRTALIAAAAYLIAAIFLLPYLEMLITALRPQRELLDRDYLPHHWAWSNLTGMWGAGFGITSSLRVSLEVAGGATILVTLVALPAAYYTARHRFRGRGAFLLLVLTTQMLQPTALIVGIYKEFLGFHLIDTVWALILVNAGFNMAFAVWILNAYFSSIPAEIEEAAMVDGSGRMGVLLRVTLPLAAPGPGHRADLHVHRGLERVHRGAHPDHQQRGHPADRPAGLVHRAVHGGLAAPVRRVPGGHHPGAHPVRTDRAARGGGADGGLDPVAAACWAAR